MKMAREDLLLIRRRIAEQYGRELTPDEVLTILNEVRGVELDDGPGIATRLRELEEDV